MDKPSCFDFDDQEQDPNGDAAAIAVDEGKILSPINKERSKRGI